MPTAGETLFSPAASIEAVQAMGESPPWSLDSMHKLMTPQSSLQIGERLLGVRGVSGLMKPKLDMLNCQVIASAWRE
jgi:hypothetical protein